MFQLSRLKINIYHYFASNPVFYPFFFVSMSPQVALSDVTNKAHLFRGPRPVQNVTGTSVQSSLQKRNISSSSCSSSSSSPSIPGTTIGDKDSSSVATVKAELDRFLRLTRNTHAHLTVVEQLNLFIDHLGGERGRRREKGGGWVEEGAGRSDDG